VRRKKKKKKKGKKNIRGLGIVRGERGGEVTWDIE